MISQKKTGLMVGVCFISLLIACPLLFAQGWQSLGEDTKAREPKETPGQRHQPGLFDNQGYRQGQSGAATSDDAGDTDTRLAKMAKKYESAVGLVVVVAPRPSSDAFEPIPLGTAWALYSDAFATNSHITEPVSKFLQKELDVFVVMNKNPGKRYRVIRAISHPRYGEAKRNFDGVKSVDFTYDVGVLKIDGQLDTTFPVAGKSELQKLDSGYRIAYLGFPMEGLINGNVDVRNPVATMQSGIITAVSDYWQGNSGFEKNVLIRHNLGATGGASGSPLFNVNGEVIGLLNAGNIVKLQVISVNKQGYSIDVKRTPHAAMVNFGQRVDLLHDLR